MDVVNSSSGGMSEYLDESHLPDVHNCTRLLSSYQQHHGSSPMNYFNNTDDEDIKACLHLFDAMGPGIEEAYLTGWWPQIVVQLLYGIVCLIGLAGNTLVIYVVVRFSKMQTVTNLYIVNLAIADELFLIGIPFLMTTATLGYWPFGNIVCKAYFTSTSINQITSSMFLLIMSADRYLAVCHPISAPKWRTPLIAKTVALTAWTLSALLMVPIFMYANTLEIDRKINCNIFWPEHGSMSGEMIFIIYSFVLGFAIPLVLILVFYVLVILRLRTVGPKRKGLSGGGAKNQNEEGTQQQQQVKNSRTKERKKSHRKVTKLVLTVITVYFLCWAPYWVTQMALIFMPHDASHSGTVLIVFLLAGCLSYSNSTMNPILYAFLSDNFKKSFKKACSCASRKEINAALNPENSIFPRRRSQSSQRHRKSSAPMTSATYAGTTTIETTMTTRSTVLPSPNLASPNHHSQHQLGISQSNVPVSKLIPDMMDMDDLSSSDNNLMTSSVVIPGNCGIPRPHTTTVHITINDHFSLDDAFPMTTTTPNNANGNSKYGGKQLHSPTTSGATETFVQDNGVVVTVL